ncbi:MAG: response regulator [Magnetovibrionaceae bacterium]
MFKMRKSILVVDDDASLRMQLSLHLSKRFQYSVVTAKDGNEGLIKARAEAPSAILLDWMMPDLSGPHVLSLIRKDRNLRKTPVAMMTGRSCMGDIERALGLGCFAYFVKPLDLPDLGRKLSLELDARTGQMGCLQRAIAGLGLAS